MMPRHDNNDIVVLISGRGSNLDAVLAAAETGQWQQRYGAGVAAVISNRAEADGLRLAQARGVATTVVDHTAFATRADFERALGDAIDRYRPALIVLAGFMRVLSAEFVTRYSGRVINIHPSLLPLFPGLNTHRQALAAGVRVHGATVHYVSERVDGGAIIAQAVVAVHPEDDEPAVAARVLAQEHRLLPHAIRLILEQRVVLDAGRVVVRDAKWTDLAMLAS